MAKKKKGEGEREGSGKRAGKKVSGERTNTEKMARRAGKVAARAELAARDALEKAREATNLLVSIIGHPVQTVEGMASTAAQVGRSTLNQLTDNMGRVLEAGSDTAGSAGSYVDDRVREILAGLGLASREEIDILKARIAELEGAKPARKTRAKAASRKAPAKKAAAKRAPAKGRARKSAAAEAPAVARAAEEPAEADQQQS
jgi:hypothetical protein